MKIYWKIFLGFWVVTVLMVALSIAVDRAVGSGPAHKPPPVHQLVRQIQRVYGREGLDGLGRWLDKNPVLSRNDIAISSGQGTLLFPDRIDESMQRILEREKFVRGRPLIQRFSAIYVLRPIRSNEGERQLMLLRLPRPWVLELRTRPWLRFLTALMVSGLVCYGLAYWLTRPVKRLSYSVKEIADGNLDARVPWAKPEGKGDELQQLARDINQMAEHTQQLFANQEQLVKGVSHELRSPLARMQVIIELIRDGQGNTEELERLEQELERLNAIVGDLLLLPRLDSQPDLLDEVIDLGTLLSTICEDLLALEERGVRIELSGSGEECLVQGRAALLRSAIENVIANALRYSPAGDTVDVQISLGQHEAQIAVRDRGPGVGDADPMAIFEPFFRVSSARERQSGGVGLGLTITRRVVNALGGSVSATNVQPGLLVSLVLPRYRE